MIPRIVFAPTLFILASRRVTLRGALTSCELRRVSPCDIRKAVVRNVATPGSCLSFIFCGCVSVSVPRSAGAAEGAVMIVAGMSAPSELCLTGRGGSAQLEACADAVAAADGKRRCDAASSQHARAFVAAHVM